MSGKDLRQRVKRNNKISYNVATSGSKFDQLKRERETLGIKSEKGQEAWHKMRYWSPERVISSSDETLIKHGRSIYESIKLCLSDVPSFKFRDYYNVVIVLNSKGIISNDEAYQLFDNANAISISKVKSSI